jgi:hypothetical protein
LPSPFLIIMTNKLPKLDVKIGKEQDKLLFKSFIRDGGVNQRRVFQSYPNLKKELEASQDREFEKTISDFVDQLYLQYKFQVDKIVEKESEVLKNANNTIFSGLEKVMNCGWDSSFEFFALPTFLPFSPFGKNRFYFSIYSEIIGGKESGRRVDRIAIHELSHICWYQKLEKAYKELGFELNSAANYYLKEAFATIIGEGEEFTAVNGGYCRTNYNTSLLRIDLGGKEMEFVDFFRNYFNERRKKGFDFYTILKEVLKVGYDIQKELDEKWSLWNKYGDNPDKLSESGYQSLIVIR